VVIPAEATQAVIPADTATVADTVMEAAVEALAGMALAGGVPAAEITLAAAMVADSQDPAAVMAIAEVPAAIAAAIGITVEVTAMGGRGLDSLMAQVGVVAITDTIRTTCPPTLMIPTLTIPMPTTALRTTRL
jgi:hypothetical protein